MRRREEADCACVHVQGDSVPLDPPARGTTSPTPAPLGLHLAIIEPSYGGQPLQARPPDGRPATLLVAGRRRCSRSTTNSCRPQISGGPYALVREDGGYRRGLDGRLLLKREAKGDLPHVRRRLTADEGAFVVEAARAEAQAAREAIAVGRGVARRSAGAPGSDHGHELRRAPQRCRAFPCRLRPCRRPATDQYLSLVVRVTEGCSWNACTFCRLYSGVSFRVKARVELADHLTTLRDYFGRSLALRRSIFLGDANALCVAPERLLPLLAIVAAAFPGLPLYSFVDAWTGQRRTASDWSACRALGLVRVYVGLESGDPELLAWLGKPGAPDDALRLVRALHEGGLDAGVIVLVGAGGERFAAAHVARTAEVLDAMGLGPRDVVYLSEYVDDPTLAYGRQAARRTGPRTAVSRARTPAARGDHEGGPPLAGPAPRPLRPARVRLLIEPA